MKLIIGLVDGKRKPVALSEKLCKECQKIFQPLTQRIQFCSSACRRRARYKSFDKRKHGGMREKLIKVSGLKCSRCGKEGNSYEIVAHHITLNPLEHEHQELLCRACHCGLHHSVPKKSVTKEQIEETIKNTKNLDEACLILGINRSSLYWKRKKFGLDFNAQFNEKKLSKEEIELAISSSGTMQEAADKLGIERTTLFDKKKAFGIISVCGVVHSKERKKFTKEQIEEAIKSSSNMDIAAKTLGLCRATLYHKRKQLNMVYDVCGRPKS